MKISLYYSLEKILSLKNTINIDNNEITDVDNFLKIYNKINIRQPDINLRKNHDKNHWRKRLKYNCKDFEKYSKNKWCPILPKNDQDKICRLVIKHLNKLNDKKFTIITKEFIDSLEEIKYNDLYEILTNEIIKKIHIDKKYLKLYAKLIKELSINKKWQYNTVSLSQTEDGYFWTINILNLDNEDNKNFYGPFDSEKDAYIDSLKNFSFYNTFISKIQNLFSNRNELIIEINKNIDNFEMLEYTRNRYLNIIEFIYWLVFFNQLKEKILLHCLLQFLNNFEENNFTEELNAFCYLYKLLKHKKDLYSKNHSFFETKINNIISNKNISIKFKFKLEDLFSNIEIKNDNKSILPKSITSNEIKEVIENSRCLINEFLDNESPDFFDEMFSLIPSKRYDILINELFNKIFEANLNNCSIIIKFIDLLLKKNDTSNIFIEKYMSIIKDYQSIVIDYPNINNYIKNILIFFKQNNVVLYEQICKSIYDYQENDLITQINKEII